MSFFDDPPPPPRPDPRWQEPKPWMGPPRGWVGGWVPWRLELLRSSDVLVVLSDVEAFPAGVHFAVVTRVRPAVVDRLGGGGHPTMLGLGAQDGILFGVGFADGHKAILGRGFPSAPDQEPRTPLVMPRGGGGGADEWRMGAWLWPLPPPGELTFVAAWPTQGMAEASVSMDASELIAAASRAEKLWDVPAGFGSHRGRMATGFGTAVMTQASGPTKEP